MIHALNMEVKNHEFLNLILNGILLVAYFLTIEEEVEQMNRDYDRLSICILF